MQDDYEIEIDESTFSMLSAIANADNDPQSLARLASVDPEEFRNFLSECGETDNKDALEFLAAARKLQLSRDAPLHIESQGRARDVYAVGDRVDKFCVKCQVKRGHVVATITKRGQISRVVCPKCGNRTPFKMASGGVFVRIANVESSPPYDPARTYRRGQVLMHPRYGRGEVTAVIDPRKIDVLFADRMRRLVVDQRQNQGLEAPAKTTFAIGDRVDHVCSRCRKEGGGIVASVTKKGRITRVSCLSCGSRVPYKSAAPRTLTPKIGAPYDRARTYRRGQTLLHPTFGEGEVTAVDPQRIDVHFSDRVRRLIHSQSEAPRKSD